MKFSPAELRKTSRGITAPLCGRFERRNFMKADIGIIGAMEPEVAGLIAALSEHAEEKFGGVVFHTGILEGKRVAIARCGVGKVFAAIAAEAMICAYAPSLIVNTGVGGAVADGLSTGSVVVAESLCQYDMDTSPIGDPVGLISGINKIYFEADGRAVGILLSAARELGVFAVKGIVATGDRFVASPEEKARIAKGFGASACEMEGGAIAQTAFVNSTPFAVVRAISDSADGSASEDYPTFLPKAAAISLAMTRALVKGW